VTLREVRGQSAAVETLTRALETGRAHHAYRFEGPDGVGKELAAMGFAQALLCAGGDPLGCGRCSACERAVTLRDGIPAHPDLVVVERGLYSAEVLGRESREGKEISVDQVRKIILAQASFSPHEGRARVFLVRRADELSTSAANALLKTLEEPRPKTHFILVTARPNRLLTTIRSRTMPVRFGPLPSAVVRDVLTRRGVAPDVMDEVVELAGGSASAALELSDESLTAARRSFVESVLASVRAPGLADGVLLGESSDKDREVLRGQLEGLAAHFASRARKLAAAAPNRAAREARAYELTSQAMTHLEGNASTNLTIIELVDGLRGLRLAAP
jgi:DNA polymerase-3 subunit delta'